MKSLRKKILVVVMAIFLAFLFSGCGTIRGFAGDVKVTAAALEKSLEPVEQSRR